ncbi:hypothetical protein LSCM1_06289 [Leishmania martiniquensis]|uniref:Uncharacterized protein n=1 Tax=Leishmania martiniquensis TaxID=1580590 RepID=A0A836HAI1_9TRYP|nr:hypothetical protein LSCM1_06289 [Leishmania martiniquensis]
MRARSPPHPLAARLHLTSFFLASSPLTRYRTHPEQVVMHQRMDTPVGGAFDTHERLRQANSAKLKALLQRTAAAERAARRGKKSALLTGDYLDFECRDVGGKWMNVGWGAMLGAALLLFYVMWFTDWVR